MNYDTLSCIRERRVAVSAVKHEEKKSSNKELVPLFTPPPSAYPLQARHDTFRHTHTQTYQLYVSETRNPAPGLVVFAMVLLRTHFFIIPLSLAPTPYASSTLPQT